MRSATCDLQNAIRIARIYWRTSTLRAALAQPFHCLFPTLLFSTLPCSTSTPTQLLLYRYDVAVSMPSSTLYAPLLCPTLFYSSLRFSTLLCYALLFSTLHNFILSLLYLYPTSTHYSASTLPLLSFYSTSASTSTSPLANSCLPYATLLHSTSTLHLLYLFSTTSTLPLHRCQLDTMISGLVRMWLHDLLTQVPTGHNDLCASENVKVRNWEFPPWNFLW